MLSFLTTKNGDALIKREALKREEGKRLNKGEMEGGKGARET